MNERLSVDRVPSAVIGVLRTLIEAGHETWLVGGGVRDLLRSDHPRPAKDWDLATSARPETVMSLFPRVIPTGVKHGTVTILTRSGPVEVTTFRGETGYTDARRPDSVKFLEPVEEDLARRDFTINAIAWNPLSGDVKDPFGGLEDLAARKVRAVRDPIERFTEDGLRPMRALRFACVLEFDLDPVTEAAVPLTVESFRKVAVERVRQELERIISARRPSIGLDLMIWTGLFTEVLPELASEPAAASKARLRSIDAAPREGPVRPALLLFGIEESLGRGAARTVLERLRYPNTTIAAVERLLLAGDWRAHLGDGPADLRRLLARVGIERAGEVAALWLAMAAGSDEAKSEGPAAKLVSDLERQARAKPPLRFEELALSGGEVMEALGLSPGPAVGRALQHLLDLVVEDPARNEPSYLREELARWAAD